MSIFEYDKEEEERKLRMAEFEAGEQRGIEKGIQANIRTCKKFNVSKSKTVQNIVKDFSLPEEKALDYVEKYW